MMEVSNVFLEMDTVYKQMVQGSLPEADAKAMLKNELIEKDATSLKKERRLGAIITRST